MVADKTSSPGPDPVDERHPKKNLADTWPRYRVAEPLGSRPEPILRPHISGNAGLYYCCYRLSLLGWNAMPTARSAHGIDVLAYDSDASRKIAIQVKSLSKRAAVPLGPNVESLLGDFWIIVTGVATQPTAYILLPSEVRDRAEREEKDGQISFRLEPSEYCQPQFHDAWDRLGRSARTP